MTDTNPMHLVQNMENTLRRYIATALPISRRYPELRQEFRRLLESESVTAGPFVETLPDFEKAQSLDKLTQSNGGFLHDDFTKITDASRPLHEHQFQALNKAIREDKSLLVATGTGSGKTECFLYPLAQILLSDPDLSQPGVRCLLIYPLNALANDQLYYRIAPLFGKDLAHAGITFGRFTSQVKAGQDRVEIKDRLRGNRKLMSALDGHIPDNFLLSRKEMLEKPPHILITNYAMLEHMLLLPRNAPLFKNNNLRAIVLDEIHTYSGAQATEVAFLLRKLKNRINITDPLKVFGTSASLKKGPGADKELLKFASNLFGEEVHEVVRGNREIHQLLSMKKSQFSLTCLQWQTLNRLFADLAEEQPADVSIWNDLVVLYELDDAVPSLKGKELRAALAEVFGRNAQLRQTAQFLKEEESVVDFSVLAEKIFPETTEEERTEALTAVIQAGILARPIESGFPLLPARYHFIVNGLEGVCVRISSTPQKVFEEILPFRHYQDGDVPYYPLLVCKQCGQPFVEGFLEGDRLHPSRRRTKGASRKVLLLGETDLRVDDEVDTDQEKERDEKTFSFNPLTGSTVHHEGNPRITFVVTPLEAVDDERGLAVKRCPCCGSRGSRKMEPLTSMHPGNEALTSVITQKVLELMPPQEGEDELPMKGRNLISFSDNRQDAAFFAPYFQRTSMDLALRTAIYHVLKNEDASLPLEEVAALTIKWWRKRQNGGPLLFDQDGKPVASRTRCYELVLGKIAAEFCYTRARNSLERLGMVNLRLESKTFGVLKKRLQDGAAHLNLPIHTPEDWTGLIYVLLDSFRRVRAITGLNVDLKDEYIWGNHAVHSSGGFELEDTGRSLERWLPAKNRKNRRTSWLGSLGWGKKLVSDFLHIFWDCLRDTRIIVPGKKGFALDFKNIELARGELGPYHQCMRCGSRQDFAFGNLCSAFRCHGPLKPLSMEEREEFWEQDHFAHLIRSGTADILRASEHTASLANELREQIESDFTEGKINLLSCTTTMEMGVDLGDLEAVVNRNIPPGISNYQQRTGRAGRRAQAAPFCVTVARNSNYDQSVFSDFGSFLRSQSPVPLIALENAALFRRHQLSILLSHFLKHKIGNQSRNAPALGDLFPTPFLVEKVEPFMEMTAAWLEGDQGKTALKEAEDFAMTLEKGLRDQVALLGSQLGQFFLDEFRRFSLIQAQQVQTYQDKFNEHKDQLISGGDTVKVALAMSRWVNLRDQAMNQFLVNRLSQNGMIPTYSFPVHNISLEISKEKGTYKPTWEADINLVRDASLGISEYAPGAEVVADNQLWVSSGIARMPREIMPTQYFSECGLCHFVAISLEQQELPKHCPNCEEPLTRTEAFIEPKAFITAYDDKKKNRAPGLSRVRERRADEARLITLPKEIDFNPTDHPLVSTVLLKAHHPSETSRGKLFIVNRGPNRNGYNRCKLCGFAEPALIKRTKKKQANTHKEPRTGNPCKSTYLEYAQRLAHTFYTDVIQLRLAGPIPEPDPGEEDKAWFWESFSHTLTEAMSFAVHQMLNLPQGEIRASFRLRGRILDVILYDASAGGAGYVARIGGESLTVSSLLKKALELLRCPKECSSSCRACLHEYRNQMIWDYLNRHLVLNWLHTIVTTSSQEGPMGGLLIQHSSIEALSQKLVGCQDIHLLAQSLSSEDMDPNAISWLRRQVVDGKCLHIHLTRPLVITYAHNPFQREFLRLIMPDVEDGRIRLGTVNPEIWADERPLPRIFTGTEKGALFWSSHGTQTPLLANLLPAPLYSYKADPAAMDLLKQLLKHRVPIHPAQLKEKLAPGRAWTIKEGQPRNIPLFFGELKGLVVESLVIKDPYCAWSEENRNALFAFLTELKTIVAELNKIRIDYQEANWSDKNYLSVQQTNALLSSNLQDTLGLEKEKIIVKACPFFRRKSFHDREMQVVADCPDGMRRNFVYDFTGGVDFLMDIARNTKIFFRDVTDE